jgi:hypothetical protein
MLAIAEPRARPKARRFYRPSGTDLSFCFISQHFVLGYFQNPTPPLPPNDTAFLGDLPYG